MKLEGIFEGSIYCSSCRRLYTEQNNLEFYHRRNLPSLALQRNSLKSLIQTNCITKSVVTLLSGSYPTVNIWQVDTNRIFATRGKWLFRSEDGGQTWKKIRALPSSSGPMGILPTGFCVKGTSIYLGEYPLQRSQKPAVLRSTDGGNTWSIVTSPDVRHIHAVKADTFSNDIFITTGDRDNESMIARLSNNGLDIIGSGEQLWRAVDIEFTPNEIIWGMDCPFAELNKIVRLNRGNIGATEPKVEILHSCTSPIYYSDSVQIDGEHHVFFSTAIEPATRPEHSAVVLHGSTVDEFETWETIAEYSHSTPLLNRYFNTNAYIFIAADEKRGLFFNPYNTNTDHGQMKNIPISQLRNSLG